MTKYLLDTNVISELGKAIPDANVITFVSGLDKAWLSTITIHEINYGLNLLPVGARRLQLEQGIESLIQQYQQYIISISHQEAELAAVIRAQAKTAGKQLHLADTLIAGTAKVHGLTIATRNVKDFEGQGVEVFNPWN